MRPYKNNSLLEMLGHRSRIGYLMVLLICAPASVRGEPVTTIQNNGEPANRVDLVILGDGYPAGEIAGYASDVDNFIAGMFAQEPFKEYRHYFNVHRVDVTSNESGSDHPELNPPVFKDTALDSTYGCEGIPRLVCVNSSKVNTIVSNSLAADSRDMILVLVNDPIFGGSGGIPAVASVHVDSVEITLHELGHSFGLLADEYGGPPPPFCDSVLEPPEVNVTKETVRAQIKWNTWIDLSTPIPTGGNQAGIPGLYEGGKYCDNGLFRPTADSKMRSLYQPFEQINSEQLIKRIYNFVAPIDAVAPGGPVVSLAKGQSQTFSVEVPQPLTHALDITWLVDGEALASATGPSDEFTLSSAALAVGAHTVEVLVQDPTPHVQKDPFGVLAESWTWDLTVQNAAIFQDDMESGEGVWSQNPPWGLTTSSAHSSTHSWTDSPGGNYANDANVSLVSPPLDFSNLRSVTLTFWHRYEFQQDFDFGQVWVTTDDGTSFTLLGSFTGVDPWSQATFNLDEFAGAPSVRIFFQILSDSSEVRDGWYIDDVIVSGATSGLVFSPPPRGATTPLLVGGVEATGLARGAAFQLIDTTGSTLTGQFALSPDFTGIRFVRNGHILVGGRETEGLARGPAFQLFAGDGNLQGGAFVLNPDFTGIQYAMGDIASPGVLVCGLETGGLARGPAFQIFDDNGNLLTGAFALNADFKTNNQCLTANLDGVAGDEVIMGARDPLTLGPAYQVWDKDGNLLFGRLVLNVDFAEVKFGITDIGSNGIVVVGRETGGLGRGPAFQVFDGGGTLLAGAFVLSPDFTRIRAFGANTTPGVSEDEVVVVGRETSGLARGAAFQIWDRLGNLVLGRFVLTPDFTQVQFQKIDINNDGVDEILVGGRETGGPARGPAVQVWNGNGNLLASFFVLSEAFSNLSVFPIDQNGDGDEEIGVGGVEAGGDFRGPAYQIFEWDGTLIQGGFVLNKDF